jgi:phosphate-selective porin
VRDINASLRVDKIGKYWFKVGQFKAPFSGEELTSSAALFSIDRALVNALVPARQIGVQIGTSTKTDDLYLGSEHQVDWAVGVFNGNGINQAQRDNDRSLVVGRVSLHTNEHYTIGFNALAGGVSASLANTLFGIQLDGERNMLGVDGGLYWGPFSVYGEYDRGRFSPDAGESEEFDFHGFFVQPGYYIVAGKWQAWYRWDTIDPNQDATNNKDLDWHWIGVSYFISGHDYKVQAAYIAKKEAVDPVDNNALVVQMQVQF